MYELVKDQHIMGFSGPVMINLVPVFQAMDIFEVTDKKRCVTMIKKMYHHALAEMHEKREQESEK